MSADEIIREFRLTTPTFSFKGDIPNVPLAAGVDYDALIAMECPTCKGINKDTCATCKGTGSVPDPDPLFVVRPLAVRDAVSDGNLKYDAELCQEIQQAILSNSRSARQGHMSPEETDYAFPDDAGLWVGAAWGESPFPTDTLYGKAYIYPNVPLNQMVRKRKAANGTLSNSINGVGRFGLNPDGTKNLRGLQLESIDFAPLERASLEALGGNIVTTTEMKQGVIEMSDQQQDLALIRSEIAKMSPSSLHEMMTKEQRQHVAEMHIREMEPSSVYEMLPLGHKQSVHESYVKEFGQKLPVTEMTGQNELKQQVAEMQSTIAKFTQEKFDTTLKAASMKPFAAWNVSAPKDKTAIVNAAETFELFIVREMTTMKGGTSLENVDAAATAAWPKYEPQAVLLRTAISGGNVITGNDSVTEMKGSKYGYDEKTGRYTEAAVERNRGLVAPHTGGY